MAAILPCPVRHGIAKMQSFPVSLQQMTALDEIDHRILRELSRDARQPNLALAEKVGLSPSACLRRVQALEKAGVIKAYRAVLDPEKLGIGFLAYVTVGLNAHTKAAQESFERAVARAPQVRECHNITGTVEYLLRIETADLAAYKHWHTDVLGILPQVRSITTFVVMGSPKDERA
jgi:Lrp/AsnC family transcriptional regulator, leucine-responsive regulatory protein